MGSRWESEDPPPEAYGRVTDAQRFLPVVAEVDRLVADLERRYDVRVDRGASWPGTRDGGVPVQRAVRLEPAAGAPLVLAVTAFPGVLGWSGSWSGDGAFPACGCDACDETAEEALERLRDFVASVVGGGFAESLSRWPRRLSTERSWPGGSGGSGHALDREDFAALVRRAPPGRQAWPAWSRRPAVVVPTT